MTEELQAESIKRLCKAFNLEMRFLMQMSNDADRLEVAIYRWAYNDPDNPGTIEVYDDGWASVTIGSDVMMDGQIEEIVSTQERSNGPNDDWEGGIDTYEIEITATVRKTVVVEAFSEEEAVTNAHGIFSVLNDGDDEAYSQETDSITKRETV